MERACSFFQTTGGYEWNVRSVLEAFRVNGVKRELFIPRPSSLNLLRTLSIMDIRYRFYRFLFYGKGDVNLGGMVEDLLLCSKHSCVLLEGSGSYPTGLLMNKNALETVLDVCAERGHIVWLNLMNMGLNEGSVSDDGEVVSLCVKKGLNCVVSLDLGGTFGLGGNGFGCVFGLNNEWKEQIGESEGILRQCIGHLLQDPVLRGQWS